jgi:tRNA 2-selenouridine synthase
MTKLSNVGICDRKTSGNNYYKYSFEQLKKIGEEKHWLHETDDYEDVNEQDDNKIIEEKDNIIENLKLEIESLKKQGEQTIDLEYLAQHQGSAFGSMGQLVQPTQEQFENNLAFEIKQFDSSKNIWLEDESITIGKRVIPAGLWEQMSIADLKVIEIPKTERLKLLLASYGILPKPFLIESTQKISKRLGPKLTQETIIAIENNEMQTFIENVLYYYDKTYSTGLINKKDRAQILYPFDYFDADKIAQFLIQQMNTHGRN